MVQTYGIVPESARSDVETSRVAEESDALLGSDAGPVKPKKEGHATIQSSVGNLANTIIGSGMFAPISPYEPSTESILVC
ncbi:hypothetical protein PHLCEN_2v1854 [Hermanssonia centrifuga]|uniref:Uncharacterized protein n=1 Tax=Hermanssonia centrifuga TaxID=98765 RepID=A0A2R6RVP0_9APHY|nr:hypothetical protein PHLCEN_2v1854 [Hermanssonia centrifuga]